jgi:hypothetical protein
MHPCFSLKNNSVHITNVKIPKYSDIFVSIPKTYIPRIGDIFTTPNVNIPRIRDIFANTYYIYANKKGQMCSV